MKAKIFRLTVAGIMLCVNLLTLAQDRYTISLSLDKEQYLLYEPISLRMEVISNIEGAYDLFYLFGHLKIVKLNTGSEYPTKVFVTYDREVMEKGKPYEYNIDIIACFGPSFQIDNAYYSGFSTGEYSISLNYQFPDSSNIHPNTVFFFK